MVQLKLLSLMTAAAILLSPQIVSACVIFSLNVNYGGPYDYEGILNAGLTDDGDQKCSIVNLGMGGVGDDVELNCKTGYEATFNFNSGDVHYHHGSFDATFSTSKTFNSGLNADYWTASVWGC